MIRGVTAALVTPLTPGGAVAEQDVARLVGSVREHVRALLANLSTGEGWALTDSQWLAMLAATLRHADGVPVLAGIQRATTRQVLDLALEARELGAAAVVATTPYGPQVSQQAAYRHFEILSAEAGLPVIVYNESALSNNTTELSTLLRICRLPNVVGVKESSDDPAAIRRLIEAAPGVPVCQGMERLLLDSGPVDGYVVALANVEPAFCARLFDAPPAARQAMAAELAAHCDRYELDRDDWYRPLKTALAGRGVLSTEYTVADLTCAELTAADGGEAP
ncbi:dihydrodipicolinate synthase family protein [Kitasatospora azatica]|uniref:dihydrodipicolinate synthase family protein n=1 Tax=Kitasatospora azatica TaxID=58347 RepID=UPI00055EA622|nr:dihydrodipicolinate synthase family protein [Kitasatospora azatica]